MHSHPEQTQIFEISLALKITSHILCTIFWDDAQVTSHYDLRSRGAKSRYVFCLTFFIFLTVIIITLKFELL